jgi:tRNA modification GTPase
MTVDRKAVAPTGERPFAALLTAPGRGAIAVIRIWGPRALEVSDTVFRPLRGAPLAASQPGELRLGRVGRGVGDEVVAIVFDGPAASVEFQCHGGSAVVDLVLSELEAASAICRDPATHVDLADADRLSALALHDLSFAPTVRAAAVLLDQAEGALDREIRALIRAVDQAPDLALAKLEALTSRGQIGVRLISGWKIAIAGRPNVGKSRLFNALAGYTRAIVDPTPGTTRDVVTVRTSLSGWPVEFADTAGLRGTGDPVESLGIERSWRAHRDSDLVLLVLDRSRPLDSLDRDLLETTPRRVVVANKSDLEPAWLDVNGIQLVTLSAERGDGIPSLISAITATLVPCAPDAGAAVPFRRDQLEILERSLNQLKAGNRPCAVEALQLLVQKGDKSN